MSVEEMVSMLQFSKYGRGPESQQRWEQIIAALKAGERMRFAEFKREIEAANAAWDAATRDDSLEEYSRLSQEIGEDV